MINFNQTTVAAVYNSKQSNVFDVLIYGATTRDVLSIGGPIGSRPIHKAIKRLGLNTNEFTSSPFAVGKVR